MYVQVTPPLFRYVAPGPSAEMVFRKWSVQMKHSLTLEPPLARIVKPASSAPMMERSNVVAVIGRLPKRQSAASVEQVIPAPPLLRSSVLTAATLERDLPAALPVRQVMLAGEG